MYKSILSLLVGSALLIGGCSKETSSPQLPTGAAPGAPGKASVWAYSGKTGIGTSYETYTDGSFKDSGASGAISKVWFSIARGIVTETMYGLIHEAQLQEMEFYVKTPNHLDEEQFDTDSSTEYLSRDAQGRPLSLAYKIVNRAKSGQYEIEKHIFTDPDSQALMMRVHFRALADGITPYLYVNPAIANTGSNDQALYADNTWIATEGDTSLSLKTNAPVVQSTIGFEGVSDGTPALKQQGALDANYTSTGTQPGNVAFTLQLPSLNRGESGDWLFVLGFGKSPTESAATAAKTLDKGYDKVLAAYNGEGDAIGWVDYLQSLPELERLSASATDGGKLLYTSAMVLKAQEDKTHAGAFIASLSNPWGDIKSADQSATGYKAVWPRDFYQVSMALLALGDTQSPKVAFEYLHQVQAGDQIAGYSGTPGWFLQKTHVDGQTEWVGVQLDQTAMPIMLGWRLWKEGVLSNAEIGDWYARMLKPAADFLTDGGHVKIESDDKTIDTNDRDIKPPFTQQERWEEQEGYSPSTTAAVIAGLVSASDIAQQQGDNTSAKRYADAADSYSKSVNELMFTTKGSLNGDKGDGNYFLRINSNIDPNDHSPLKDANGQVISDESLVMDAGFLELVRYGVRPANDPAVLASLPELDNQQLPDLLRVKYEFTFPGVEGSFPGWRRYGIDGYGEDSANGMGYAFQGVATATQRGRVWPIFTGERGHYELARAQAEGNLDLAQLRNTYVKAMELFANQGMMIPEQVWDGVGSNSAYNFTLGEGTDSATPLAWSHAEYIKLLRSYADQQIWDNNASTAARFAK